jgi:hypothetical protein
MPLPPGPSAKATRRVAPCRMLDHMGKPKRQSSSRAKKRQPDRQRQAPAERPSVAQRVSRMPPPQVLDRIRRIRTVQQEADAELAALIDHAVELGVSWPEIATQLGVTRQAARQHYQRRHRDDAIREDRSV